MNKLGDWDEIPKENYNDVPTFLLPLLQRQGTSLLSRPSSPPTLSAAAKTVTCYTSVVVVINDSLLLFTAAA